MSTKPNNLYMHLIDGKPAYYEPGEQIYFASNGVRRNKMFCKDLATLRKEQEASRQWRRKQDFKDDDLGYDYLRTMVMEGSK